jgi:hypothetical protein
MIDTDYSTDSDASDASVALMPSPSSPSLPPVTSLPQLDEDESESDELLKAPSSLPEEEEGESSDPDPKPLHLNDVPSSPINERFKATTSHFPKSEESDSEPGLFAPFPFEDQENGKDDEVGS